MYNVNRKGFNMDIIHLNKPPIKEVIIGISAKNLFTSSKEILDFYDSSSLHDQYSLKEEYLPMHIEISEEPKIVSDTSSCVRVATANEALFLESNKLMFADKSEYKNFDNFFKKYLSIMSAVVEYTNRSIDIDDIGLRYVNKFPCPMDKLGSTFLMFPAIHLNEDDNHFASMNYHLMMSSITSTENPNISASVKVLFHILDDKNLDITFDIDTHLNGHYNMNRIDDFKLLVSQLQNFKNKIFFSNFANEEAMKGFQ